MGLIIPVYKAICFVVIFESPVTNLMLTPVYKRVLIYVFMLFHSFDPRINIPTSVKAQLTDISLFRSFSKSIYLMSRYPNATAVFPLLRYSS